MQKKTIFFDLGNVLLFFDHKKMCQQAASLSGLPVSDLEEFLFSRGDLYERGGLSSKRVHEELCHLSQKPIDFSALMVAISDIFVPNVAVITLAQMLKQLGHRLFILSNTCEAHFTFALREFPFLNDFDGYVLSYEVNARKPEKKIYEKALEIASASPSECFYTDDILTYIEAARSLQIDAEQFTTYDTLTKHLRERSLL